MYFGSIRFFKNLILLCVIVMILVPTTIAVRKHASLALVKEQVAQLEEEVGQMREQLSESERPITELEDTLVADEEPEISERVDFTADAPEYQSLYPDFYAPQVLNTEQSKTPGMIYLTFDDGPTKNTDTVLQVLAEKDVKATFFVTGPNSEKARERMRAIVDQGHTLGMHTYCHDYDIIYDSVEAFLDDMYQVFVMIKEATGEVPTVFRFAGGSINSHNVGIHQELMAEMLRRGFIPYDWNMSAQDATSKKLSVDNVIKNVLYGASSKSRGIVLMHDGPYQATTAEALGTIIDRLREMGFQFDRIRPEIKPILFDY